ncbi:MAG: MFS transporter [Alphaproteobacteria bacterium]|nr:MFS transporter [Alphaproteobacteria bacterium]
MPTSHAPDPAAPPPEGSASAGALRRGLARLVRGPRRAFRHADYATYSTGNLISLIGTWMQRVAVGWLTWELTGSTTWLGLMALADLGPAVVIAPLAGVAADRWHRRRLLAATQAILAAQALMLAVLSGLGWITVEALLALTLLQGAAGALAQPARLALLPALVPRADLSAAVGTNSILFNLSRFIGPALAGPLLLVGGGTAVFAANTLSYGAFLLALARLKVDGNEPGRTTGVRESLGAETLAGLRYVARHPGIAPLITLLLIGCVSARPFTELLPGFASAVFAGGPDTLATLTSAVGAGAVGGGLWLSQRDGTRGLTRIALVSTLGFALALLAFAATKSLWVAVPALAAAGFTMVSGSIGPLTLLQLAVDPAMRGRVLSLYGLIFRGGPAIGALVMGVVAEVTGLRWPLVAGALLLILALAMVARRRRGMIAALEAGPPG